SMDTELVMVPLKIAIWQRDRDGHALVPGGLICHADYAEVSVKPRNRRSGWPGARSTARPRFNVLGLSQAVERVEGVGGKGRSGWRRGCGVDGGAHHVDGGEGVE